VSCPSDAAIGQAACVSPAGARPRVLIVAGELGAELADALAQRAELEVELAPPGAWDEGGSARPLGTRMVALERLARDRRPGAAVIAADRFEALAASLAFSKLEVPIALVGAGADEDSGAIVERLCELLLCSDESELARLRRAGLGERAQLIGAATSDDALRALTAWILSRAADS
jgi:UDP-N-acetylglucosamine 2-epimerase